VDLTRLGAARLAALVRAREVTAVEVAHAHLERHERVDAGLRALVAVDADRVLRQAAAVDAAIAAGRPPGPLAGVPVGPKDNLDVVGETTAAGSLAFAGSAATRDATSVARARAAGAVLLGRGNMDELAMGASTQTSAFGATRHPWDTRRSPGGSSGGSAAAVASHQLPLAIGTDTGGSLREPGSQCGLVAMAPSVGLVPADGVVPFAPALDRVGPLARSVADARLLLEVLGGRPLPAPGRRALRVGLVDELAGPRNRAGVLAVLASAVDALAAAGHDVVPVSVPSARGALDVYSVVTAVDSLPVLERYAATGAVGAEVLRRLDLAREARAAGGEASARAEQRVLTTQVAAALADCDVLLSPTMPTTAPVIHDVDVDALTDPLGAPYTDCWTVVANLAGVPALSVPGGLSPDDQMPVGVMLMAPAGSDALLLAVGEQLEAG